MKKKKFEILNLTQSLDTHHYNQRSMVERVNKYLKEDFGCSNIYYKGATKVASVLAFNYFISLYSSEFETGNITF